MNKPTAKLSKTLDRKNKTFFFSFFTREVFPH